MNKIAEKVAYIKGLSDGAQLDDSKKEGQVLKEIIDALEMIADTLGVHDEVIDDLLESVNSISEDLEAVEDIAYGMDEDVFDEDFFEYECPKCKETIYFDAELFDDDAICPNCGAEVSLDS